MFRLRLKINDDDPETIKDLDTAINDEQVDKIERADFLFEEFNYD
jgi:hypothetical protein